MNRVAPAIVLLLVVIFTLSLRAQQQSATASLTITDNAAVEKWSRSTYGQQPNSNDVMGDTQLLLSMTPAQRQGAYLFKQHCNACHGPQMASAASFGPRLSKVNVGAAGMEDAVRTQIMQGSDRMPAFRYALQSPQVNMIIEYLKTVPANCTNCKAGDVRRTAK
jgi:cytochrome c2